MNVHGIPPIQGLLSSLLESSQPGKTPLQVSGNGPSTVNPQPATTNNVNTANASSVSSASNASNASNAVNTSNPATGNTAGPNLNFTNPEIPVPELSLPKTLAGLLTGGIQEMNAAALAAMYQKLGMDYEKRFWKALNMGEPDQGQEFREIKDTLKAQLIAAAKNDPEAKLLLDNLTILQLKPADQLAAQSYFIMDLPYRLKDNTYQTRIAFYGEKKGKTLDMEHSRIGLYTVTDALGPIGIDALFRGRTLNVTLFTELPDFVTTLWNQLQDSIIDQFAAQGYQLHGVRVSPFGDERFDSFIQGIGPKGVDIKV